MTDIDPTAVHTNLLVGSPGGGPNAVGAMVMDAAGNLWECTAAGTPGTWVQTNPGEVRTLHNTIARTDTSAKALFTLPAGAVITALRVYVPVASDAGTTAIISVGKSGTQTAYLNAQDVKGAGTGVVAAGAKTTLGSVGASAVPVTGLYAETGGASTTGGDFAVYVDFVTS